MFRTVGLGSIAGGALGGAGVVIAIQAVDQYSSTFKRAKTSLKQLQGVASLALKGLAVGMIAFGAASVKTFADFETKMQAVTTILPEGVNAMNEFGDAVKSIATEMPIMGGQIAVAEGLYQTLSAGITDTAEATQFLRQVTKLSIGGQSELNSTVKLVASTINAFGFEVSETEKITDIFFKTVQLGITTMPELVSSMGRVNAIAPQLGVSLEEVAAAVAALTQGGQSTDEAVTALRQTMIAMVKPSENLLSLFKEMGVESGAALVEQEGFAKALTMIKEAADENGVPMQDLFTNIRALQAVLPLSSTLAGSFSEKLIEINNASGATEKAVSDMSNTLNAKLTSLKNKFEAVKIEVGEGIVPEITELGKVLSENEEAWVSLGKATGKVLVGILKGIAFMVDGVKAWADKLSLIIVPLIEMKNALLEGDIKGAFGKLKEGAKAKLFYEQGYDIDKSRELAQTGLSFEEIKSAEEENSKASSEADKQKGLREEWEKLQIKLDESADSTENVKDSNIDKINSDLALSESTDIVTEAETNQADANLKLTNTYESLLTAQNKLNGGMSQTSTSGGFAKTGAEAFAINAAAIDRAERASVSAARGSGRFEELSSEAVYDPQTGTYMSVEEQKRRGSSSRAKALAVKATSLETGGFQVGQNVLSASSAAKITNIYLADSKNIEQNVGADLATQTGVTG